MTALRNMVSRNLVLLALLVASLSSATAQNAENKLVPVLELYTSQGCSSCPPADRHLGELQKRSDLVALSLPVDYWDYLGWQDTLARADYSARQRMYSKVAGFRSIYTPQLIVNGVTHAVGSRPNDVERAIEDAHKILASRAVPVRVNMEDTQLVIEADEAKHPKRPATIWLAAVSKDKTVAVKRGENSGRTITYHNVVREMTKVGEWNGKAMKLTLPWADIAKADADTCAILIQEGIGGPIIGAAMMSNIGS